MIVSTILCLALNVFYETRNATRVDQEAVAVVAINRAQKEHKTVCHIIEEPKQFSWTAKYRIGIPRLSNKVEKRAWSNALQIARTVVHDRRVQQRFSKILYYHAHYVRPIWDRHLRVAFTTPFHTYYLRS